MASKKVSGERLDFILKTLQGLYPDPKPPLDHTDNFTLLVAVLLSAQTTDKKVNEVTPELFRRAPDVHAMAKLSVSEIQQIIRQIGLAPQKAKALAGLAAKLLSDYGGSVPHTRDELESLPGVGRKTASVVLSQAFGIPSFPVDTHIHRLAMRWGLSQGKSVLQVEEDLREHFPEKVWNHLHLQIIFYGRQYCGARQCDGNHCTICSWCRQEDTLLLPQKGTSPSVRRRRASKAKPLKSKSSSRSRITPVRSGQRSRS